MASKLKIPSFKVRLQKCIVELVEQVDYDSIQDELYANNVLSLLQREDIDAKPTRHQKVRALIDILHRKPEESYVIFKNALHHAGQDHLVTLLEGDQKRPHAPWTTKKSMTPSRVDSSVIESKQAVLKRVATWQQASTKNATFFIECLKELQEFASAECFSFHWPGVVRDNDAISDFFVDAVTYAKEGSKHESSCVRELLRELTSSLSSTTYKNKADIDSFLSTSDGCLIDVKINDIDSFLTYVDNLSKTGDAGDIQFWLSVAIICLNAVYEDAEDFTILCFKEIINMAFDFDTTFQIVKCNMSKDVLCRCVETLKKEWQKVIHASDDTDYQQLLLFHFLLNYYTGSLSSFREKFCSLLKQCEQLTTIVESRSEFEIEILKSYVESKVNGGNTVGSKSQETAVQCMESHFQSHFSPPSCKSHLIKDKAFVDILNALKLTEFYEGLLNSDDVIKVRTSQEGQSLAFRILERLFMRDLKGRDNEVFQANSKLTESEDEQPLPKGLEGLISQCDSLRINEIGSNALDVLIAIFHCCSLILRQTVCEKLFLCQIAYPLLLPSQVDSDIIALLWSLRQIKIDTGSEMISLPSVKMQSVAFMRIGTSYLSKSTLMNTILGVTDAFFNKNSQSGDVQKTISNGIVECCVFQPREFDSNILKKPVTFLNLRGDATGMTGQMLAINHMADITVVLLSPGQLNDTDVKKSLKMMTNTQLVILLQNRQSLTQSDLTNMQTILQREFSELLESTTFMFLTSKKGEKNLEILAHEITNVIAKSDVKNMNTIEERLLNAKANLKGVVEISVDEYTNESCKYGKEKAKELVKLIEESCPYDKAKDVLFPLQGSKWLKCSELMRQYQGNMTSFQQKSTILDEQRSIESKMKKTQPSMAVIQFARHLHQDSFVCSYFILWLKLLLDEISVKHLSKVKQELDQVRRKYEHNRNKLDAQTFQQVEKERLQMEKTYTNSSISLEHFFREIVLLYSYHGNDQHKIIIEQLPTRFARLMLYGIPLELLDGDAANVPIKWITDVIDALAKLVGDAKIYVLSILGIQSSGKSTLLNTAFGINFDVRAGRCTRGIYMQLIPVDKDARLPFDYLLVMDTEGLRSQESSFYLYTHDNMLATFVTGLADTTIVNIKGETIGEMRNILEIVVHAFIKIRLTQSTLKLKNRCMFIHQNVPAHDAERQLGYAQNQLMMSLNEITAAAASSELDATIQRFSQIIQFECKTDHDVWYFPDCWQGSPPMAPTNPVYSQKTLLARCKMIENMGTSFTSPLNLLSFSRKVDDLWKAVSSLDFVFSFRNSLEIQVGREVETEYLKILNAIENVRHKLEISKRNEIKRIRDRRAVIKGTAQCISELELQIDRHIEEGKVQLTKYFDNHILQDIVLQWKQHKLNQLQRAGDELKSKAKDILKDIERRHQLELYQQEYAEVHKMQIKQLAIDVAKANTNLPKQELIKQFNIMWRDKLQDITFNEREVNVDSEVYSELYEHLKRKELLDKLAHETKHELSLFDVTTLSIHVSDIKQIHYGPPINGPTLLKKIKNLGSTVTDRIRQLFSDRKIVDSPERTILQHAKGLLEAAEYFITCTVSKGGEFDKKNVKEVIDFVERKFDEINNVLIKTLNLQLMPSFQVLLLVRVCSYVANKFQEMHELYQRQYGIKATVEKYRTEAWNLFLNTASKAAKEKIAADMFCDRVLLKLEDSAAEQINEYVRSRTVSSFSRDKFHLIVQVLRNLIERNSFNEYAQYIRDPETYCSKWLRNWMIEFMRKENEQIIKEKLEILLKKIKESLQKACGENKFSKMIDMFSSLVKDYVPLSSEDLQDLKLSGQKDDGINHFEMLVLERLSEDFMMTIGKGLSDQWDVSYSHETAFKTLWGCPEKCPFCFEPCSNANPNHYDGKSCHSCTQHKPVGINGIRSIDEQSLQPEPCNVKVSTTLYLLNHIPDVDMPYREYKKYHPEWDIAPSTSTLSCKYWMWFMNKYKEELITYYEGTNDKLFPPEWAGISETEAERSLAVYLG